MNRAYFENPEYDDTEDMADKAELILRYEELIDSNEKLYLITWNPKPEEMPDAPFEVQHRFNINMLSQYCKCCSLCIFCCESTQLGNPHYHGWYQKSSKFEPLRIVMIKTMQRFGLVKITKSKGYYRINGWKTPHGNCLYYYKKELIEDMLPLIKNPITYEDYDDTDWNSYFLYFMKPGKKSEIADYESKITQREYYKQFYSVPL